MIQPFVSVIVTTKNNHQTLDACLRSIVDQSYEPLELIVVDNNSRDDTKEIAQQYTPHVFNYGPERSTQRNFGVRQATGQYVAIIDSDMELDPDVISACVKKIQEHEDNRAVIIPEESFGDGFWAQCKRLERSFYVGIHWIEAARFFDKASYVQLGGYDESMVSGEDWDLSKRMEKLGPVVHIDAFIRHNEGHVNLWKALQKKYYYAQHAGAYFTQNQVGSKMTTQVGPLQRYKLFFSRPTTLLKNPVVGIGMLFMKTCEFGFGSLGYFLAPRKGEA